MEYVEGETLRDRIARRGPLSDEEALGIARALADALEKARRMGIVHRDVKPGNVLMARSGTPKLMDLGLAKGPLDMGLTQHGATVGTPQFISPEQAQDPRRADTRSDIYSLGATLYAMVTTRPPFEGATLAEIITKVLYQQPVPPRMRNPEVSPEVGHLIERMMLKDPSLRYQTPAEVVADIDMIRGGQSIVPKGFQGNWEAYLLRQRQRVWIRRGAIALAASLVIGVGTFLWMERERKGRAQEDVRTLTASVLALADVTAGDTAASIRGRLEEGERLAALLREREEDGDVRSGRAADIELKLRQYRENLDRLAKLDRVEQGLLRARTSRFHECVERLELFERDARGFPPALERVRLAIAEITAASDRDWRERQDAVLRGTAGDLDEFRGIWRDWRAALDGDYVPTPGWREAVKRAQGLDDAAARIVEEVQRLRSAFSGTALEERVRSLELFDLKASLRERTREAVVAVEAHWEAFRRDAVAVPKTILTGENGYVRLALERVEADVDRRVEAQWQALRADVERLDVDEALARLEDFLAAAERGGYYPRLAREARELTDAIDAQRSQAMRESKAAWLTARGRILDALRRGQPRALEASLDEALAQQPLSRARRKDVEGLKVAVRALDDLHAAVRAFLRAAQASGQRLADVRLRTADGSTFVDKRWTDVRVDDASGLIRARVQRAGSRREDIAVALEDIHPAQLKAWAVKSPEGVGPLVLAVVDLMLLPPVRDEPGVDLREVAAAYVRVLQAFERIEGSEAWTGVVRALSGELDELQQARETLADAHMHRGEIFVTRGKYVAGLEFLDLLSTPKGKLRYTRVFDANRAGLEDRARHCREQLAQQELLRMLPGADVEELPGGRHRFTFDLDDPSQLPNFERGYGELVPTPGAAITPIGHTPQRLLLLKDAQGLVRDRPFSILSMFDPHEPIVVEFRLDTLRGSFLVAFDVDGVQLAVCSADPNHWKWRLDPSAPLLDGEESLPEFDWYGRGRGIAFHEGPDFGASFPLGSWRWPVQGQGRHFERWKDKPWVDKRRTELFAFEPGTRYAVRIVRNRGELSLSVDGELVVQRHETSWEQKGAESEIDPKVRNGSGRIQILTWTPMAIDDLRLEGRVREGWRARQKERLTAQDRAARAEEK
jgi:hypothetical protein